LWSAIARVSTSSSRPASSDGFEVLVEDYLRD